MKNKKVINFASLTEYKALEKYFENMARKGYMLTKLNKVTFVFEKVEPKELEFNVSLFHNATIIDYPDKEEERDYRQLCEESGWTYCTGNELYQIFYKEKSKEAIPIHTDDREEYKIIKSTFLKTELISLVLFLILMYQNVMSIIRFDYSDLFYNLFLIQFFTPIFLFIIICFTTGKTFIWLIKNGIRLRRGKELKFSTNEKAIKIKQYFTIALFIFYVLLMVMVFGNWKDHGNLIFIMIVFMSTEFVLIWYYLKKIRTNKKRTRGQNARFLIIMLLALTIIFSSVLLSSIFMNTGKNQNVTPTKNTVLHLSDFGTEDAPDYKNTRESSSLFVPSYIEYNEHLRRKSSDDLVTSISTTIIVCRSEAISDYIFDSYIQEEKNRIEENLKWAQTESTSLDKIDQSITTAPQNIWEFDRGYYLDSNKSEIIFQIGKTIYILDGNLDFSKQENIKICINQLGLNNAH